MENPLKTFLGHYTKTLLSRAVLKILNQLHQEICLQRFLSYMKCGFIQEHFSRLSFFFSKPLQKQNEICLGIARHVSTNVLIPLLQTAISVGHMVETCI